MACIRFQSSFLLGYLSEGMSKILIFANGNFSWIFVASLTFCSTVFSLYQLIWFFAFPSDMTPSIILRPFWACQNLGRGRKTGKEKIRLLPSYLSYILLHNLSVKIFFLRGIFVVKGFIRGIIDWSIPAFIRADRDISCVPKIFKNHKIWNFFSNFHLCRLARLLMLIFLRDLKIL